MAVYGTKSLIFLKLQAIHKNDCLTSTSTRLWDQMVKSLGQKSKNRLIDGGSKEENPFAVWFPSVSAACLFPYHFFGWVLRRWTINIAGRYLGRRSRWWFCRGCFSASGVPTRKRKTPGSKHKSLGKMKDFRNLPEDIGNNSNIKSCKNIVETPFLWCFCLMLKDVFR